jgi:putative ATP-dependent endonuclease of the OLD family
MFLHPQMQRSLYKTFQSIGETNQIIYTTHSPHFVSIPEYRNVLLVRRTKVGGTTVTLSQLEDAKWRREKLRQALDTERTALFFARRVLFVEGDTERLALPEFAKKLGLDTDNAAATIVEVGGKRNLADLADLAISFGIPTGIICDKDSSEFHGKEQEEAAYNQKLGDLARSDGSIQVWCLDPDYESCAKAEIGSTKYETIVQRYSVNDYGKGKARCGRMIAADAEMSVPSQIAAALRWAVGP